MTFHDAVAYLAVSAAVLYAELYALSIRQIPMAVTALALIVILTGSVLWEVRR